MKRFLRIAGFILALAFLVLTFFNASWLAPSPRGYIKLIAHRGVSQLYSHKPVLSSAEGNLGRDTCTATRIEPPAHDYLENTLPSLQRAAALGAQMIEVDIAPTKDGRIALFHDWTVDCRTEGHGETRDFTLAELKALDAGYGYSADGGKSFPFRGKGVGLIPSLEEALTVLPTKPILFNFKSKDPAEADLLAAALKAAGRDVEAVSDGFYGAAAPVARIRQIYPKAWAWGKDEAIACTKAYLSSGWLGVVPEECQSRTIMVPLNYQWAFPGWPNRLMARMAETNTRVVLVGPYGGETGMGLDLPEMIRDIPASFTGYVWVDDIWSVGPAVRPAFNKRNPREEAALAAALERRRARRE